MPYRITQCYLPSSRGDMLAFTPAEAGTRLSDPGGMQGLVGLLHTETVYPPDDGQPPKQRARRVCCWALRGQEISIDGGGRTAANASSVTRSRRRGLNS